MKMEQIEIAKKIGKMPFKVTKDEDVRYTLGSSKEQCKSRFTKWHVENIDWEEFFKNYDTEK